MGTGKLEKLAPALPVAIISAVTVWRQRSALNSVPKDLLFGVAALVAAGTSVAIAVLKKSPAEDAEAANRCPATEWPRGKPLSTKTYPGEYDLSDPKRSFEKVCDLLIDEVVAELPPMYEMPGAEVDWVRKMLDYNVKGGKMNRGVMVVECGRQILEARGQTVTSDALFQFAVLGWCIEWMQAWLLVADDVMDDSLTRRGQPCWYRQKHVGMIALNDAFTIEMLVYKVIKRHFSHTPHYVQILDLFMETTFQTECGQLLDTLCDNLGLPDLTIPRWELIVKYKTAFYSFYLPVALGMILGGVTDPKVYNSAREILMVMGIYFQAQDDYLDCYATPEVLGKIGTDIQDKKCGWLFVHAYHELVNAKQKAVFDATYGQCKVGSKEEKAIKELYTELGLPALYQKYEAESYEQIMRLKSNIDEKQVPWSVFETFLKKIYKRGK